ncbi:hypothetical protein CAEBREN_02763 [Caenorhabditis brenneri]|uniref:Uncharacterized protein n=1 Tax=Caenorhabditis brenneri TaxID=135651 RepID=G0PE26_CAEBE|nr:hypothetical protein CAEBREN_02763 [Caenorhabditis brenneri]
MRFDHLECQRQKELDSLQNRLEELDREIRQVEEENEGAKMGVLGPMSLSKQGEVMALFDLKRHEELAKDGMARMQEGEKEAESIQESVQLLQEICDEHFRPKELKKQVEENTLALEMVFMDMEMDKENKPPPC